MKTKNLGDEFATFQDLFDTVVTRLAAGGNCRWVFDCIGVHASGNLSIIGMRHAGLIDFPVQWQWSLLALEDCGVGSGGEWWWVRDKLHKMCVQNANVSRSVLDKIEEERFQALRAQVEEDKKSRQREEERLLHRRK